MIHLVNLQEGKHYITFPFWTYSKWPGKSSLQSHVMHLFEIRIYYFSKFIQFSCCWDCGCLFIPGWLQWYLSVEWPSFISKHIGLAGYILWVKTQVDVIILEGEEGEGCLLTGSHRYLEEALPVSVTTPTPLLPVLAPAWPRADWVGHQPQKTINPPTGGVLSLYQSSHNKESVVNRN